MTDTRVEECWECQGASMWEGGPTGWEIAYGVDHRDGDVLTYWVNCPYCQASGFVEIEAVPIEFDEIEEAFGPWWNYPDPAGASTAIRNAETG